MSKGKIVWSDEHGDLRKKKSNDTNPDSEVDESSICLQLRRLTSGKGRAVIEITALPNNKNWCKKLAKEIKKNLGVGGAYKNNFIEVHGEKLTDVKEFLDKREILYKQIGG